MICTTIQAECVKATIPSSIPGGKPTTVYVDIIDLEAAVTVETDGSIADVYVGDQCLMERDANIAWLRDYIVEYFKYHMEDEIAESIPRFDPHREWGTIY